MSASGGGVGVCGEGGMRGTYQVLTCWVGLRRFCVGRGGGGLHCDAILPHKYKRLLVTTKTGGNRSPVNPELFSQVNPRFCGYVTGNISRQFPRSFELHICLGPLPPPLTPSVVDIWYLYLFFKYPSGRGWDRSLGFSGFRGGLGGELNCMRIDRY